MRVAFLCLLIVSACSTLVVKDRDGPVVVSKDAYFESPAEEVVYVYDPTLVEKNKPVEPYDPGGRIEGSYEEVLYRCQIHKPDKVLVLACMDMVIQYYHSIGDGRFAVTENSGLKHPVKN